MFQKDSAFSANKTKNHTPVDLKDMREHLKNQCIHELFEKQAEQTPAAIALNFAGEYLTYQELNQRANQLAHHLRAFGIGQESLVGICLERSSETIVAILGILKTGGAFVPLDPAYPKERLIFMLHDAQIALLITQQSLAEHFVEDAIQMVYLDTDRNSISQCKTHNLVCIGHTDNLAYIIYTSGSTGKPKGVMITHRGLCNLALTQKEAFNVRPESHILQFASLSFDASVSEIFIALLSGATLHLETKDSLVPGLPLIEVLQQRGITIATLPPSTLAILPHVELPELQTLITAGEACPASLVAQWASGRDFFNAYGPTETTVCATIARCNDGKSNPPIGRPIAHIQVYVLDENIQPVPVGVLGEIHIGGIGLARGYLGHPELTAERFIPNPFDHEPGSRLYKTGDLARYLPDGQIEFLGRSDSQVKIRGFRIELGEIEAILNAHLAVREAVVIVREDEPGEARLVAYLIINQEQGPILKNLRDDLKTVLPDYMIPSAFVVLKEWPLTPNGKIDRHALPVPDSSSLALLEPFIAPRTPCEDTLAYIWSEKLHLDQIGIHDSFFNLGGHSLLATQIIARIRSTFQIEVSLATFFANPTIAGLASYIEQQDRDKQYLQTLPIQLLPRVNDLPLSFSQERVWFLQQLDPTNMAYNAQAMLRLTGQLDVASLESSLREIVRRHEIFRTTFPSVNGRPIQLIHQTRSVSVEIPLIDLQATPEAKRMLVAQQLIDEEIQKPFDVTQLPLVRWVLLRLHDQEHILLHVEHHLVHDGWSFTVFLRELQELYTTFVTGKPSSLSDLTIQFADFAQWQRQWMQGEEAEAQLTYWKQKLAGSPTHLELFTDHPRPAILGFKGAMQRIDLPISLCEALRIRCRREGVTLFMLLLGTFLTLLYRYTGQDDLCVGTSIANRRWQETESLIGMIINTLVLRTDLSANPSFRELLKRVREVTLEAYTHQDLPFGKVVEVLQPERSLSRSPLYQVLFSFHDSPLPDLKFPGLKVKVTEGLSNHSAKFDLNIVIIPRAEQLVGIQSETEEKAITLLWEYNTDLFIDSTIQRMVEHYKVLLNNISIDPAQHINEIPLLTQVEQQQILCEWNNTTTDYPQGQCIHQLFEKQVEQTPDALAVVCGKDRLTYYELNQRSNQLAHYLQTLGVGPDVLVGICMERSLEVVIGILGILKAGGAYVPLDPYYPKDRQSFMINDSRLTILLTQKPLHLDLSEPNVCEVCFKTDWEKIAKESTSNLITTVAVDNLAYVIYTSGSTGQPKGAGVYHRGFVNLLNWFISEFKIDAQDKVLLVTSLSFDLTQKNIFAPLMVGGLLHLQPSNHYDARAIAQAIFEKEITMLNCTPSAFYPIVDENVPSQLESLRYLFLGGEPISMKRLWKWLQFSSSKTEIVNTYGPTECTDVAAFYRLNHFDQFLETPVPIGKPISNVSLLILDKNLSLLPVGGVGELYLGGTGVGSGYINNPILTSEKFISNPFKEIPGKVLYRTGDLARYLPDGIVECLGRSDYQIKLRGYRIELGEIELALRTHSDVQDTVVVVREDSHEEKHLVAYIVPVQDQAPKRSELRYYLQDLLPDYMVPSTFVFLDNLPLTPNGKVNRNALPAHNKHRIGTEENYIEPRSSLELQLTRIFEDILNVYPIGVTNNFFSLGGHSLLAVRLMMQIRQTFGQDLPLSALFQKATVEHLASILLQQTSSRKRSPLVGIQLNGSKPPFFCVHTLDGDVLCYMQLSYYLGSNRPFYGFEESFLYEGEPSHRIEDMAKKYVDALLSFQPEGPYYLGGWSLGGCVAFEMACQLHKQGHEIAMLALLDTLAPSQVSLLPEQDETRVIATMVEDLIRRFAQNGSPTYIPPILSETDLRKLEMDQQLQYFLNVAQTVNFVPPDTELPQLYRYLQFNLAHFRAVQNYAPETIYPNKITMFRTSEFSGETDPTRDWERFTAKPVEVHMVPGNHMNMVEEPHVKFLAEKLTKCIEGVQNV